MTTTAYLYIWETCLTTTSPAHKLTMIILKNYWRKAKKTYNDNEEVPDKTEVEENNDEATHRMAKQLKEMEDYYDVKKENNKVLQGKVNHLEEVKRTNDRKRRTLAACAKNRKRIFWI